MIFKTFLAKCKRFSLQILFKTGTKFSIFMMKVKMLEKVGQCPQKSDFSAHNYSLFCFLHIMVIKIEIFRR